MPLRARSALPILGLVALGVGGVFVGYRFASQAPAGGARLHAEPPAWKGDIARETGARVLALEHLPATFELADDPATATLAATPSTWTLSGLENVEDGLWHAPLPFELPTGQGRFAPEGMTVSVDGREIHFQTHEDRHGKAWWKFSKGQLEIGAPTEPGEVRIDYPGLPRQLARLSWTRAREDGTSPADFVHHAISLGEDAREGLLLPAPASATWAGVTIPAGARFEAHLALAPSPLELHSDGAEVALVLVGADGAETELGRTPVPTGVEGFTPWTVDLAAQAGVTGTLALRTLPGAAGDAAGDLVFVAAPEVVGKPDGEVRRVVVIGIDTLRPDHLGLNGWKRATSPEIDTWARNAVVFDRAWTSAPRTRPSFRAATTGRNPLEAICAKNIGAVFDEAGFATAGIVANVHLNARFDFHRGFDLWHLDSGAKVDQQVDRAIDWLDAHQDRDSYLFLHVMDPHVFYVAPPEYSERFTAELPPLPEDERLAYAKLSRQRIYAMMHRGRLSELQQQYLEARYDAEIAYTSHELGRLLDHLHQLPGKTVIVMHSDHGEEFWEHGGYEHNHTLYDDTTRGLLIIEPPGGAGGRSPVLATLPDIAPTLYELVGLKDTPPTDGISLVPALRGDAGDPERALPIGYLLYDAERWGVVWRGHKYILFTGTGKEELYDLESDPGEHTNLAGTVDTEPYWKKLAEVHKVRTGPGWRLDVDVPPGASFDLALPAPLVDAGVLDPEAVTHRPVNQEWGEVPPVLPADVGTLTRIDDRTLRFVAGSKGEGVLWVLFDHVVPAEGTLTVGDATAPLGDARVALGGAAVTVKPGIVVLPRESEASRMLSCLAGVRKGDEGAAGEHDLLKELGYLQEGNPKAPPGD